MISAGLVFEGGQVETQVSKPELGLEIYTTIVENEDKQSFTILGSIQNLNGDKLYKGPVKLMSGGKVIAETNAHELNEIIATEDKTVTREKTAIKEMPVTKEMPSNTKPNELDIKAELPGIINHNLDKDILLRKSIREKIRDAAFRGEKTEESYPSTLFEFNIPIALDKVVYLGGGAVQIEHNGITKTKNVIGGKRLEEPQLETAVVSPIEEIINSRINPAMGKDMKRSISDKTKSLQAPNANIDVSQNHGVLYSLVQTPPAKSGIYSFKDDSLKLNAQGGTNGVTLSWITNLDTTNIEGYKLYRGTTAAGEELVPISGTLPIKGNTYVDTKVSQGTTYYYLCSVVYKNGDEFIISNEVMITK